MLITAHEDGNGRPAHFIGCNPLSQACNKRFATRLHSVFGGLPVCFAAYCLLSIEQFIDCGDVTARVKMTVLVLQVLPANSPPFTHVRIYL